MKNLRYLKLLSPHARWEGWPALTQRDIHTDLWEETDVDGMLAGPASAPATGGAWPPKVQSQSTFELNWSALARQKANCLPRRAGT